MESTKGVIMRNIDPNAPWNNPTDRYDPFAPQNDPSVDERDYDRWKRDVDTKEEE